MKDKFPYGGSCETRKCIVDEITDFITGLKEVDDFTLMRTGIKSDLIDIIVKERNEEFTIKVETDDDRLLDDVTGELGGQGSPRTFREKSEKTIEEDFGDKDIRLSLLLKEDSSLRVVDEEADTRTDLELDFLVVGRKVGGSVTTPIIVADDNIDWNANDINTFLTKIEEEILDRI